MPKNGNLEFYFISLYVGNIHIYIRLLCLGYLADYVKYLDGKLLP